MSNKNKVEISVTFLNGTVTTKKLSIEQFKNYLQDVRNKNISLESRELK